jgi:hypothetical protein
MISYDVKMSINDISDIESKGCWAGIFTAAIRPKLRGRKGTAGRSTALRESRSFLELNIDRVYPHNMIGDGGTPSRADRYFSNGVNSPTVSSAAFRSSRAAAATPFRELRKVMGTSKLMTLVPLLDLESLG